MAAEFDLVIRGGTVVDGTGGALQEADIAISGGKIAAIGQFAGSGAEEIDARGRITASLPFGTNGYLDAALPGALPATPYARWGEIPALLLLAGCFLWALRKPRATLA